MVLVSCGSFNPPTFMHLRMMELAQQQLMKVGGGGWVWWCGWVARWVGSEILQPYLARSPES